ncbi:MAG: exo-alpha-sialidase, partial [Gemmatimonadetes bacterium]|nr:exo-alpha-sialidase [Gemmatimonadota bacterium]
MRPSAQSNTYLIFGRRPGQTGRFSVPWIAIGLLLLLWLAPEIYGAAPTFENRTPVGFSSQDSTTQQNFVLGRQVTVRADLSQAATPTHPVYGHFHNIEQSKQVESTDVDGLQTDLVVDADGVIHMAWISQETTSPVTTPIYHVRYARSEDKGKTFSSPASVSGALRYDLITINVAGSTSGFSTLDIEVDSRGNPRVVYAMNHSADGHTDNFSLTSGDSDNIYFNYSENGGASWLPGDNSIVINDTLTVGSRSTAFPRMAIDQRDNIYISYVRGSTQGTGADDIMLAKVDRETTPFTMVGIGSTANTGSGGGVRISPDAGRHTGPDIDMGTGDVLHIAYFNDTGNSVEHKTLLADAWKTVGGTGWNQDADGAGIDDFTDEAGAAAIEEDAHFFFPTVVVDKQSS